MGDGDAHGHEADPEQALGRPIGIATITNASTRATVTMVMPPIAQWSTAIAIERVRVLKPQWTLHRLPSQLAAGDRDQVSPDRGARPKLVEASYRYHGTSVMGRPVDCNPYICPKQPIARSRVGGHHHPWLNRYR
jgi:hypothetical protein